MRFLPNSLIIHGGGGGGGTPVQFLHLYGHAYCDYYLNALVGQYIETYVNSCLVHHPNVVFEFSEGRLSEQKNVFFEEGSQLT